MVVWQPEDLVIDGVMGHGSIEGKTWPREGQEAVAWGRQAADTSEASQNHFVFQVTLKYVPITKFYLLKSYYVCECYDFVKVVVVR